MIKTLFRAKSRIDYTTYKYTLFDRLLSATVYMQVFERSSSELLWLPNFEERVDEH